MIEKSMIRLLLRLMKITTMYVVAVMVPRWSSGYKKRVGLIKEKRTMTTMSEINLAIAFFLLPASS